MIVKDINLEQLDLQIDKILKKDICSKKNIDCCPICSSKSYIKYGSYKEIQRYKCKICNKTFSKSTNSMISYSKKSPRQWFEFIELMMEKKSLRFCAKKLGINLGTAFYWRHKILHSLSIGITPDKLNGDIHIGKYIIKENFKGNRNITSSIRRNIWIIGAKGQEEYLLAMPIFKDYWDLKAFKEKVYCKISKSSYIIPYGDRYLFNIAKKHNKKLYRKEHVIEERIKYFMLNLSEWFDSFYGIATKYLKKYLSWFALFNSDKLFNYIDILYFLNCKDGFIRIMDIRNVQDDII